MEKEELFFLTELYNIILIALITVLLVSLYISINRDKQASKTKNITLYSFAIIIALLFGFRDTHVGYDTVNYIDIFSSYIYISEFEVSRDALWDLLNYTLAQITDDPKILFLIVAFGYIFFPICGVKKILTDNTIYFFLLFIISPNFFLYGANGIRSGLAASIFIFSFRFLDSKKQWIILLFSFFMHASMAAPILFYIFSKYIKKTHFIFIIWGICLALTILGLNLLSAIPFESERLSGYLSSSNESLKILNMPVTFLTYGIIPIIFCYYIIHIKKLYDPFFNKLAITYILSNCIYILSFNVAFTVRFAYLSEFLMPLLITYPIFKFELFKHKELKLTFIFLFVFLLKAYKIYVQ